MANFISDADMAKMESRNFISDEDMAKMESPQEQTFLQKYGKAYIEPSLEAVGGAAGSIIGGGLGSIAGGVGAIPGAVVGSATGYAGGKQLYRLIEELTGEKPAESLPKELAKTTKNLVKGAAYEMTGQAAGKALSTATKAVPGLTKKLSSAIYKVPEQDIERIVSRPEQVKRFVNQEPVEIGYNLLENIKQKDNAYVKELNKQLDSVINTSGKENKLIDVSNVVNSLRAASRKIKPMTEEAIGQKDELVKRYTTLKDFLQQNAENKIKKFVQGTDRKFTPQELKSMIKSVQNKVTPMEAQALKRQLQDASSEKTATGLVFKRRDPAGKALRKASTKAKNLIEKDLPEVKSINKKLQENIQLKENSQFKNAFREEGIENLVKNVQSKKGNRGFMKKQIQKLDKMLGTNVEELTKDVHAAQYLESNKILPQSVLGVATPAGLGYMAGGIPGAVIGGAASSPSVFRTIAPNIGKITPLQQTVQKLLESGLTEQEIKAILYQQGE